MLNSRLNMKGWAIAFRDSWVSLDELQHLVPKYSPVHTEAKLFRSFSCLIELSSCGHHHKTLSHFHHPHLLLIPISQPPTLCPSQLLIYLLTLQIYLFWTFHANGIVQYAVSCFWSLSLDMCLKFICGSM